MGKIVKTSKILSAIYNAFFREKLRRLDNELVGSSKYIALTFEPRYDGAYTFISPRSASNRRIVIGGEMIKKVAELPDTFSTRGAFMPYRKAVCIAFYALNYHEVAHNMFTDMKDPVIKDYPIAKYQGFLHSINNILEDIVIEQSISAYYKVYYPKDINPNFFFKYMVDRIFMEQCKHYTYMPDPGNFLNYLLLVLRCGKASVKASNEIFDKYSEELLPRIKDVLTERKANDRLHKAVELGEWIIENIKEFDWSTVEVAEHEKKSGSAAGIPMPGGGEPGGGEPMDSMGGDKTEEGSGSKSGEHEGLKPREGSGDDGKDGSGSLDEAAEEADTGSESEEEATEKAEREIEESLDDMNDELEDTFIDRFEDGSDHVFILAKDYYEVSDPNLIPKIDKEIESYVDAENDVADMLKLFRERGGLEIRTGFDSGELDVDAAIQDDMEDGINLDLFQDEVKNGVDIDLCVSLVCDNSGSMSGSKSVIASQAALVLAQACEWAEIPFECSCFTKTHDCSTGTSVTIIEKRFEDSFEESKPYFGINDSGLIRGLREIGDEEIPTFSGNSEEVNLYYIWQKYRQVEHKTKLMIVFSDGCTTGSKTDLKNLVREMEEDGIIVIGVGIECHEVADIYPLHKIFGSTAQLREGLAQYLIDTLSQYAGL